MAMSAMNMVSTWGFSGMSFHLRRCPQGVASVLCKKTPIFGSRPSKLDHLTVFLDERPDAKIFIAEQIFFNHSVYELTATLFKSDRCILYLVIWSTCYHHKFSTEMTTNRNNNWTHPRSKNNPGTSQDSGRLRVTRVQWRLIRVRVLLAMVMRLNVALEEVPDGTEKQISFRRQRKRGKSPQEDCSANEDVYGQGARENPHL